MVSIETGEAGGFAAGIPCSMTELRVGRPVLRRVIGWLAVLVVVISIAPSVRADDAKEKGPAYRVIDVSLVYMGNPRLFKKPCVVDADRVYKSIPEYVEIVEKNLTDRDVRYHFLMKKASDKFAKALRGLVKDLEYDLIASVGAIVPTTADAPVVVNATDGAIARLPAS